MPLNYRGADVSRYVSLYVEDRMAEGYVGFGIRYKPFGQEFDRMAYIRIEKDSDILTTIWRIREMLDAIEEDYIRG